LKFKTATSASVCSSISSGHNSYSIFASDSIN
jgi:hypothetical protein